MIDLPTKMLKELAEDGSSLPEAVIFHNLAELAEKQGTLEVTEEGDDIRVKGMVVI